MSDFDKEAEREKLREQFAADEDDRETTERMSELLLQGATMTNRHCEACGNPVFRYDGQAFCPTCQRPAGTGEASAGASGRADPEAVTADGDATGAEAEGGTRDGEGRGVAEEAAPDDDPRTGTGGRDAGRPSVDGTPADAASSESRRPRGRNGEPPAAREGEDPRRPPRDRPTATGGPAAGEGVDAPSGTPSRGPATDRGDSGTAGLGDARASLERTTTRLSRLAAESDDLGRTREYLAAAREAAEALAAVKRAGR